MAAAAAGGAWQGAQRVRRLAHHVAHFRRRHASASGTSARGARIRHQRFVVASWRRDGISIVPSRRVARTRGGVMARRRRIKHRRARVAARRHHRRADAPSSGSSASRAYGARCLRRSAINRMRHPSRGGVHRAAAYRVTSRRSGGGISAQIWCGICNAAAGVVNVAYAGAQYWWRSIMRRIIGAHHCGCALAAPSAATAVKLKRRQRRMKRAVTASWRGRYRWRGVGGRMAAK